MENIHKPRFYNGCETLSTIDHHSIGISLHTAYLMYLVAIDISEAP